jgi:Domain of Unknown Function (DUF928)
MKSSLLLSLLILAAVVFAPQAARAQSAPTKETPPQPEADKPAAGTSTTVYKPPLRGAPATRVGGGTRNTGSKILTLSALAPNEAGYTVSDKPTLYWYLSESLDTAVELTITPAGKLQEATPPLLEITLKPPVARGVHALRLEDHGVGLKPGVEYQWFVAVVSNPAQRSNDVVAGGSIIRIADSPIPGQLRQVPQTRWPAVYAEGGVWYDAIDTLSRSISAQPADRQLRQQRAALLEQVGLPEAAAFDRGAAR